ncbi:MAG: DUF2085 domain-containing protein [Actinomycetota bacterium]|nr:MAG: DUF2085 domain-containing protein [Actinomycetota bacterium]
MSILFDILAFFGGGLCHQRIDRSFNSGTFNMPVCSRCTGIYLGIFLSLLALILIERRVKGEFPSLKIVLVSVGAFLLMGLEVVLSTLGFIQSNNIIRMSTGFLMGWFMVLLLLPLANNSMFKKYLRKNYLDSPKKFWIWILAGLILCTIFIFTYSYVLILWSIISVFGMVTFTTLILFILFFSLTRRLTGSIDSLKKFIISIITGIAVSLALLSLFSYLRQFLI